MFVVAQATENEPLHWELFVLVLLVLAAWSLFPRLYRALSRRRRRRW